MLSEELSRDLILAQTLQAVAQTPLERGRRVRIERHEIPEWLAAVSAQVGERRRVGIRMAGYVFTNRAVLVFCQFAESLAIGARMLADQAQKVEVGFRRLFH